MGYLSRRPTNNDPPRETQGKSPWLKETELADEFFLLVSGLAERCSSCQRTTRVNYLNKAGLCPDCRVKAPG